jgi:hypothetical protein
MDEEAVPQLVSASDGYFTSYEDLEASQLNTDQSMI